MLHLRSVFLRVNETFYTRIKTLGLPVRHACEVGVYYAHTSNVLGFINDNIRTTLVEADPDIVQSLQEYFADRPNVHIIHTAVYHTEGTLTMCRAGASTFAKDLPTSPALANDRYTPNESETFSVRSQRFEQVDDGTIDVLSIDTEGCEWYVLETMKSRPVAISVELKHKKYVNPFQDSIRAWMQREGYTRLYRENSDEVFVKSQYAPKPWWKRVTGS